HMQYDAARHERLTAAEREKALRFLLPLVVLPVVSSVVSGAADVVGAAATDTSTPSIGDALTTDIMDAHPTFRPGPFANDSIPARSSEQTFTSSERTAMREMFEENGCHTCGTHEAGTKYGDPVPDHQPVSALNFDDAPQRLFPQCLNCSNEQMRAVAQALR